MWLESGRSLTVEEHKHSEKHSEKPGVRSQTDVDYCSGG